MALIDTAYFKADITIGDISNGNSPVVGNTVALSYIPKYEKEYLIKALGYELYKAFTDGLLVDPVAQKWVDLRDGKDYTVGDRLYRWNGFINSDKVSPIAYYIYVQYMIAFATVATGTGTKVSTTQNATNITPAEKIGAADNKMWLLNNDLWHFLNNNTDTYTEWVNSRSVWCFGSTNAFGL